MWPRLELGSRLSGTYQREHRSNPVPEAQAIRLESPSLSSPCPTHNIPHELREASYTTLYKLLSLLEMPNYVDGFPSILSG